MSIYRCSCYLAMKKQKRGRVLVYCSYVLRRDEVNGKGGREAAKKAGRKGQESVFLSLAAVVGDEPRGVAAGKAYTVDG